MVSLFGGCEFVAAFFVARWSELYSTAVAGSTSSFLPELASMSFHALVLFLSVKAVIIGIAEAPRGPLHSKGDFSLSIRPGNGFTSAGLATR